jgi:DNA polymerase III delta prime subunit
MLKNIRLKFGPTPDAAPLQFTPGAVTVFVGPPGAGKSLALRELARSLGQAPSNSDDWKILADIEAGLPPSGERRERILAAIRFDLERLRAVNATESAILNTLVKVLRDPDVEPETLDEAVSWLDVTGKRTLVEALIEQRKLRPLATTGTTPAASLLQLYTLIQALIERSDERLIADGLVHLGGYNDLGGEDGVHNERCLLLDASALRELADSPLEALHERIARDHHFIILDDPGACLSPALAHRLGINLGNLAAARGAYVFAATPAADSFLKGCIESGQEVTLIRLGFADGHACAQLLPRDGRQALPT